MHWDMHKLGAHFAWWWYSRLLGFAEAAQNKHVGGPPGSVAKKVRQNWQTNRRLLKQQTTIDVIAGWCTVFRSGSEAEFERFTMLPAGCVSQHVADAPYLVELFNRWQFSSLQQQQQQQQQQEQQQPGEGVESGEGMPPPPPSQPAAATAVVAVAATAAGAAATPPAAAAAATTTPTAAAELPPPPSLMLGYTVPDHDLTPDVETDGDDGGGDDGGGGSQH